MLQNDPILWVVEQKEKPLYKGVQTMNTNLREVIQNISKEHSDKILGNARNYMEVDLGRQA